MLQVRGKFSTILLNCIYNLFHYFVYLGDPNVTLYKLMNLVTAALSYPFFQLLNIEKKVWYKENAVVQEAVPLDSSISNACSATIMHESASRDETEALSLVELEISLAELSISVVHCTSGVIPTWSMSWRAGDRYFATVTKRADPSWSSVTLWN